MDPLFQIIAKTTDDNVLLSPEEKQNDLELDFKVFFFVDSGC